MSNPYQTNLSKKEVNQQLLIGLKRHLMISQDTTAKKDVRLTSLTNLAEVLEYVVSDINSAVSAEEQAILRRFFQLLLTKVKFATIDIHNKPETFNDEIAFISILLKI
ncbi:hypothetical protein UFOVP116_109 [uncultured Caudovirales phage]|uniref:Uncharacterized protein n=1 Tax=uncultured Caudovirales phage TaxID=2100421 RepID=A0A6J5LDL0_9CAUD|nr:hypothetical protein UFOVP116_109 [uncultured Caudovirales phage]